MAEEDTKITSEQAIFIEARVNEYFAYVRDCYDQARREGTNVLQWLFGVTTGAIAVLGYLLPHGNLNLSVGIMLAAGYAAYAARALILALKTRLIHPPGNFAKCLNTMLNEPIERMQRSVRSGEIGDT
jgi:hypothetical protein